jgi:hypothetical protein
MFPALGKDYAVCLNSDDTVAEVLNNLYRASRK